jgi:thiamine biosynthesis protein ThiS
MQPELVEVVVNGERKFVPSDLSVSALLRTLDVPADRVAVELNKRIVRKRNWEETLVPSGSQIEIVQFVGGG